MVCVSVQEKDFAKCREILSTAGMVELRGDLCGFSESLVGELVQMHPNLLYTHRIAGSTRQKAYRFSSPTRLPLVEGVSRQLTLLPST